jgi:hypothetical protein
MYQEDGNKKIDEIRLRYPKNLQPKKKFSVTSGGETGYSWGQAVANLDILSGPSSVTLKPIHWRFVMPKYSTYGHWGLLPTWMKNSVVISGRTVSL